MVSDICKNLSTTLNTRPKLCETTSLVNVLSIKPHLQIIFSIKRVRWPTLFQKQNKSSINLESWTKLNTTKSRKIKICEENKEIAKLENADKK